MKKVVMFLLAGVFFFGQIFLVNDVILAKEPNKTLYYGSPDDAEMDKDNLDKVDKVVQTAIEEDVTPGAVVLVAKDNTIVKEQAYGYAQKYDMGEQLEDPVKMKNDTIFDLASVTKVMATTQGIMHLVSKGEISVDDKVTTYIPGFGKNGKENVTIADLLTHTSGLKAWDATYLHTTNHEGVLEFINNLPLEYETGEDRVYSDYNFMTLGFVIEKVTGESLDDYLNENIYQPLGMTDTMFNPENALKDRIAATEWGNQYEYKMIDDPEFGYKIEEDADDFKNWRDYTLVGEVNDGNSYYANGGVAGHAGLFSTAYDLAVLGQSMLNDGKYKNVSLYDENVIDTFTSKQRYGEGYGWELNQDSYMGENYSEGTFGHTGFTGTQVIFDPNLNLQIIVLTNKQNNGALESGSFTSTRNLSSQISNEVYKSIDNYEDEDTKVFSDVSKDHWASDAIYELADQDIIRGYEDGSFHPGDAIQRQQAAVILANALNLKLPDSEEVSQYFDDVQATDIYADNIAAVAKADIMVGNKGEFAPYEELTREQLATILVKGLDLESGNDDVKVKLSNVSKSHRDNVKTLADLGYTNQIEDFRPREYTTRAQMSVFLNRSYNN